MRGSTAPAAAPLPRFPARLGHRCRRSSAARPAWLGDLLGLGLALGSQLLQVLGPARFERLERGAHLHAHGDRLHGEVERVVDHRRLGLGRVDHGFFGRHGGLAHLELVERLVHVVGRGAERHHGPDEQQRREEEPCQLQDDARPRSRRSRRCRPPLMPRSVDDLLELLAELRVLAADRLELAADALAKARQREEVALVARREPSP